MARARAVIGAAMASLLVVACNLLTGVGDLTTEPDVTVAPNAGPDASIDASTSGAIVDTGVLDTSQGPVDTGPPPTCPSAGHSCVALPPEGWEGPFLAYVGPSASVPPCPAELPDNVDAPTEAPAGGAFACECRCGGVTGSTCKALLDEFDGTACDQAVGQEDLAACRTPGGTDSSMKAELQVDEPGSCPPSAIVKAKDEPSFPTMLRLCGRPTPFVSDGCSSTELCVPDGVAPFKTHTCILNADDDAKCPAPWTDAHRVYDGVNDTRVCNLGSCGCNGPTGINCSGRMRNYTTAEDCTGTSTPITLPLTTCTMVPGVSSQKVIASSLLASGGSCTPKGAPALAGGVTGTGGKMVCCLP